MKMESMLIDVLHSIAIDESQPAAVRLLAMKLVLMDWSLGGGGRQIRSKLRVTAKKQPRNSERAWTR